MTGTEWVQPGADAVILVESRRGTISRVTSVKVDRVLKRDVVCSDGTRFRRDSTAPFRLYDGALERREGTAYDAWHSYLIQPDHPAVEDARGQIRLANRRNRAVDTYEKWRLGKASATNVAEAFTLLADTEKGQA